MSHVSPDQVIDLSLGPAAPDMTSRQTDTSSLNNAQFETQQPELPVHDFELNDIQNLNGLVPGALLPSGLNDAQGDFWLDQAMMDIDMQAYNYINTSPDAAILPQGALPSPIATQQEMFRIVCGLTGDMDPYVMQRYNFSLDNNFVFKRLTVQSMSQGIHPVQLLAYNQSTESAKSDNETTRELLEGLVSPDVGTRLISLYEMRVL